MSGESLFPTFAKVPRMFMRTEPRNQTVCFMVSESERETLKKLAEAHEVTLSSFCTEIILEAIRQQEGVKS